MNPDSGEDVGGMAVRTRSRTQHLSDEEERTEKLRVHVKEQDFSGKVVGPGAMVAPREPLDDISTTLETNQSTLSGAMPLELSPEIKAMQVTIKEMANHINVLVQAVTRCYPSRSRKRGGSNPR